MSQSHIPAVITSSENNPPLGKTPDNPSWCKLLTSPKPKRQNDLPHHEDILQSDTVDILYSLEDSPYGTAVIASKADEICMLAFADSETELESAINRLRRMFPHRELVEASTDSHQKAATCLRGEAAEITRNDLPFRLNLKGTPFQMAVWKALLEIPCGSRSTYSDIAREIGRPKAVRAVGSAIGRNPVAYFIPCHRVVRSDGALGGYHWGVERKRMMLEWESSLQPQQPHQQAEMHFR